MADDYFSSVKLLLHCDGSDGSTTFSDSGPGGNSVTVSGGAQIDTGQKKWGTGAAQFDGSGDYLTLSSSFVASGTQSFTYEAWVYLSSLPASNKTVFDQSGLFYLDVNNAGNFLLYVVPAGQSTFSGALAAGTWRHVAVTRSGSTWSLYVDGSRAGTIANGSSVSANNLLIGRKSGQPTTDFPGWLDDIRITVGVARYSGTTYTVPTEAFPDEGPTVDAISSSTGPLGAALVLAEHPIEARSSAVGPLGEALILASDTTILSRAEVDGPLAAASALASIRYGIASAPTPLGAAEVLSASRYGLVSVDGPLATAAAVSASTVALASATGPLGAALPLGRVVTFGRAQVAGPLGAPLSKAWNDSLLSIPATATTIYTCDIVDGATVTRIPISSWQATIQTGAASYLQVVVPAAAQYADAIASAIENNGEIVVYRGAKLSDGSVVESEMARAPISTATTNQGPTAYTATLSGYASAWTPDPDPPAVSARTLEKVRSISMTNGLPRVRCAIDWLLQPGLTAVTGGLEFPVGYINFYATSAGDTYCDVGQSSTS